ncbi:MAG TPA: RluA family pseudouridine synthase [Planococcus sp. (in: firmicutes)]|nr:RluA family pseudouridine synthase [Planococcus sp. (in: firmicutes)]
MILSLIASDYVQTLKPFQLTYTSTSTGMLRLALNNWGISKRTLAAVKYGGGSILVNGVEVTVRHVLNKGDAVTVIFPVEQQSDGLTTQIGDLSIVYEDEALLIVDKMPFQNTIPSREHPEGSLANFVAGHFQQQGTPATLHILTRLDRDTSGLVCIAKNRHIHHLLSGQQKTKEMKRGYEAFVHGTISKDSFVISEPIGRKSSSIIEREVRADGKNAETEVSVISKHPLFSHIKLQLNTGRTHQIRVHLAHIGHPLLGDDLYGGKRELIGRQALHCCRLELLHPLNGQHMAFQSKLNADMENLI